MGTITSDVPSPNPSQDWSNPTIVASVTNVRKPHVDELRTFLEQMSGHVHNFGGTVSRSPVPSVGVNWTDPAITAGATKIRDDHWLEIRAALEMLDGHYHVVPGYSGHSTIKDIDTSWDPDPLKKMLVDFKIFKQHIDEIRVACLELYNHTHTISYCDCVGRCDDNCWCNHQDTCVPHW